MQGIKTQVLMGGHGKQRSSIKLSSVLEGLFNTFSFSLHVHTASCLDYKQAKNVCVQLTLALRENISQNLSHSGHGEELITSMLYVIFIFTELLKSIIIYTK